MPLGNSFSDQNPGFATVLQNDNLPLRLLADRQKEDRARAEREAVRLQQQQRLDSNWMDDNYYNMELSNISEAYNNSQDRQRKEIEDWGRNQLAMNGGVLTPDLRQKLHRRRQEYELAKSNDEVFDKQWADMEEASDEDGSFLSKGKIREARITSTNVNTENGVNYADRNNRRNVKDFLSSPEKMSELIDLNKASNVISSETIEKQIASTELRRDAGGLYRQFTKETVPDYYKTYKDNRGNEKVLYDEKGRPIIDNPLAFYSDWKSGSDQEKALAYRLQQRAEANNTSIADEVSEFLVSSGKVSKDVRMSNVPRGSSSGSGGEKEKENVNLRTGVLMSAAKGERQAETRAIGGIAKYGKIRSIADKPKILPGQSDTTKIITFETEDERGRPKTVVKEYDLSQEEQMVEYLTMINDGINDNENQTGGGTKNFVSNDIMINEIKGKILPEVKSVGELDNLGEE